MKRWISWLVVCGMVFGTVALVQAQGQARKVISLDGVWQVAQGSMDATPTAFDHTVPVPGLLDMAKPAFEKVGAKADPQQAFWYRRSFAVDGKIPDTAILLIHKARYGTKVWLNGQLAGEHMPCFTPAYLDVKSLLKGEGQENVLVIRVGAGREALPKGQPDGWDFEKYLYIPGIYDSVELILTGNPYIVNIQTVPQIDKKTVRVVAEIANPGKLAEITVGCTIREAKSGKVVHTESTKVGNLADIDKFPFAGAFPIPDCQLWSPEDPFLYEIELTTPGDAMKARFGMRSFRFDPKIKRAILNDKTYYMRGTNVCIYRFFEDALRGDKPWRAEWVRRLHEQFRTMNWNSIRYCIGFPPDFWYDIADEVGFLIQDEFPIWLLSDAPTKPTADKIIPEYTDWMRQRWNHPCVVIWDAQNESFTPETAKAIAAVRGLDLSGRPWENGWEAPQSPTDCVESHPYLFIRDWNGQKPFRLTEMPTVSGVPNLNDAQKKQPASIIINEYCWLWLNRDGTPTTLTKKVYADLLGPESTTDQRRLTYARTLAALTEFWRTHRQCAGVLNFCGLGYSRDGAAERPLGGATSDNFIDLEKLVYEPFFEKYIRDAFDPVGVMLDVWAETLPAESDQTFKAVVINDLPADFAGVLRLNLTRDGKTVAEQKQDCKVPGFGRAEFSCTMKLPAEQGSYTLIAERIDSQGKAVRSLRDFKAVTPK